MNNSAVDRVIFLVALSCLSTAAAARLPQISGELTTEMQKETGVRMDDSAEERSNTFLNLEAELEIEFSQHLSIEGTALLEPVRDFEAGRNTLLEEEGVFIEELLISYENGPWEVFAGKFSPDYKNSRDQERGIWTEDFSKEYEIVEKLGVGAAYTLRQRNLGTHTLSVSAFSNDVTTLARSIGTDRDELQCRGDRDLSSSAVLLEGRGLARVKTFYYQLGFRHVDGCEPGARDEAGFMATLGNVVVFAPSERVTTDLLTEFSYVEDFEGSAEDRQYYSVSSVTHIDKRWTVSIGATVRLIAAGDGNYAVDHLFQLSAGYRYRKRLRVEAGWLNNEEFGLSSSVLGMLVRYQYAF